MFSFVMLERGLEWYRRLLIPSLPDNQQLNINPKNCIGTVLSINGYRKYFCECSSLFLSGGSQLWYKSFFSSYGVLVG